MSEPIIAVVTTFPNVMWKIYAEKMLQSFVKYWPEDVPLLVALDDDGIAPDVDKIVRKIDGFSCGSSKSHLEFLERNKDKDHPTDYRKQVCRFSHKVFTLKAAADYWTKLHREEDGPRAKYLVWLDADVLTTRKVERDDIVKALPKDGDAVAYLGRKDWAHSECGWLAFDITCGGAEIIDQMVEYYVSDKVLELDQWDDSFVFDTVAKGFPNKTNLTPDATGTEVWPQSPMATWSKHYKGPIAKQELGGDKVMREMPIKIQTKNSIPDAAIQENIAENQKQIKNWIFPCKRTDEEIVVVSAGPFLIAEDLLEEQAKGKKIVAVKHALGRLSDAGVKPWACILLDPRPHVYDFVQKPDKDVIWLVASQVTPKAVKKLLDEGCTVIGYHAAVGANESHLTALQPFSVVNGGSATSTRGLFVLERLGFTNFKLYGYDLCTYEKPDLKEKDEHGNPKFMEVFVDTNDKSIRMKRTFWTKPEFIAQYVDFKQIIDTKNWGITAYGQGMIPHLLSMNRIANLRRDLKMSKLGIPKDMSVEDFIDGAKRSCNESSSSECGRESA